MGWLSRTLSCFGAKQPAPKPAPQAPRPATPPPTETIEYDLAPRAKSCDGLDAHAAGRGRPAPPAAAAQSPTLKALDVAEPQRLREPYFMGDASVAALKEGAQAPRTNHVDYQLAGEWIRRHKDQESRRIARVILQNIERVPEAGLQRKFVKIAQALCKISAESDFPLVALETFKIGSRAPILKSTDWMLTALNERHPSLVAGHVHADGDTQGANVMTAMQSEGSAQAKRMTQAAKHKARTWAHWQGRTIDLVILDDASYSGTQLSDYIEECGEEADTAGVKLHTIWVGLTAATPYALGMFDQRPAGEEGVRRRPVRSDCPVRLLTPPMLMQTVDQAIRSQKAVPQKGRRKAGVKTAEATLTQVARMYLYSANTDVLRRKTIVYLPHKVPDRVSCLDGILAAGVVGDVNISWGSESERPFIPQTRPPYKA